MPHSEPFEHPAPPLHDASSDQIIDTKSSIHSQTFSSSSQNAYTIEDLLKDCERILHTQYGIKPTSPFRDVKYPLLKEIWETIGRYLYQQLEHVKSVSVNNIGRFSFLTSLLHTGNNGVIETKKVVFVMNEAFARDFNVKLRRNYRKFVDNSIPTIEVNYFLVAQKCCTTKEVVLFVMKLLRSRLGEIMSGGKKVRIEFFSVGSLKCDKRIVSDFEFVDSLKKPITQKHSSNSLGEEKRVMGSFISNNRMTSQEDLQLLKRNPIGLQQQEQQFNSKKSNSSSWRNMIFTSQQPINHHHHHHRHGQPMNDDTISVAHSSISNRTNESSIKNHHHHQSLQPQPPPQPQQHRPTTSSTYSSLSPRQLPRGNAFNVVRSLQTCETQRSNEKSNHFQKEHSWRSTNGDFVSKEFMHPPCHYASRDPPDGNIHSMTELMNHQFSAAVNYGPHENGFRQPNAQAAKTVMNLAVQRYAQELESARREQQQDLDQFYRQLIHNVCVSEELRRRKREEAQQVQTQLVQQMQQALMRKASDDQTYSNYFNNEEDSDLETNKNGLLMGFKKSARGGSKDTNAPANTHVRSSLPSKMTNVMHRVYPYLSLDEQNPLQQGLHIPDRIELKNYFEETVRSK
ncbi:hypothetical protein FDP41_012290 [Naegleria fowleri]|uniref:CCDC81 HU domain-containing protein n=1 Tax=Naegleria fowleri TaxID=5763 RepID=A0A6A5BU46_NAEFO|nr:uncharacterized protein FDP41_012290 [Naegleria fowleri]KAF0981633.1 hypothetical protein FDP41_012290 [Naegleria fowleri]